MAFRLTKIDEDKDNMEARFRLVNEAEKIDVVITRRTFRRILESLYFSSQRIGCILRLINRQYPISFKKFRVKNEERFSDDDLIEYLKFYGFKVKKKQLRVDLAEVIRMVEKRGYEVRGNYEGMPYSSPVVYKN
jgi:hypothetical protein